MKLVARPPVPNVPEEISRCTGHCCRSFTLSETMDKLEKLAQVGDTDAIKIIDMVIPIRETNGRQIYDCRHLAPDGNCQIYETRPQMCKDYPSEGECTFDGCTRRIG